jgi:hypothetical protein
MEKNILSFRGGGSKATVQEISLEIKNGNSERLSYESYKTKYINGKQSGVTNVGISGVSDTPDYLLEIDESNHLIQITAKGDNTSGTCTLTQEESGNQYLIHCTTPTTKITNNITIRVYKSASSETRGHCVIRSDQPVATDITFKLQIQHGVSSGDQREYTYTLSKDRTLSENLFAIQKEADPQLIDYSYSPQSDSQYICDVTVL